MPNNIVYEICVLSKGSCIHFRQNNRFRICTILAGLSMVLVHFGRMSTKDFFISPPHWAESRNSIPPKKEPAAKRVP